MSAAFRLSSKILIPSGKCYVTMRPMLQNINRISQFESISPYLMNLKTNPNLGMIGYSMVPVLNYSSKSFVTEIEVENSDENVQLYSDLFKHNNHHVPWREYSQDKMDKKKHNEKEKLIVKPITKNLTYISARPEKLEIDKNLKIQTPIDRPLCLLFSYMLAKKKHLLKFAKIYTDLGFDVLLVEITPWQLLWPTKGSQLIANDTVNFLYNNQEKYSPMIIHGFSVGGYQWGELMVIMSRDLPKYQPVLDKFRAQIWDSAADISEISVGLPKAIFPKNLTLQAALRNYAIYHLKTFYQAATVHYARSSNFFHFPLLKAPALFLVSKIDPVGSVPSNWSVKEDMESIGIKTTWQCWDDSHHVMHYLKYPDQYLDLIYKHLRETHVLEDVAQKTGIAKL
ncbi:uncharacterized protein LOC129611366 [Condylostylus longicornis]|uniref:uncharacterized protein LOC129611366 n=1 Tax=Condylostylus longicornis TaxID=2530218 RepID=UPI00244E1E77|nr:uncharacterized protein LOC129611366 [Condylostylus longicornis]